MSTQTNDDPDIVSLIMAFDDGSITYREVYILFASLIKSGLIYSLQWPYLKHATQLIEAEILTPNGNVTEHGHEVLEALEGEGG